MVRCGGHSSVQAAATPGADASARAPTGRRAFPTDGPAAPISEASPAGPPVAPRINAVTITPVDGRNGRRRELRSRDRQRRIRMRAITTLLATSLGQEGQAGGAGGDVTLMADVCSTVCMSSWLAVSVWTYTTMT